LESSTIRESQRPRFLDTRQLIHNTQVQRGLFLRLSSGKEADNGESWHNRSGESLEGLPGDILGLRSLRALSSRGHHVGFQHESFNKKFLIEQGLHDSGENTLRDLSANLNRVGSVLEDLGLDDGHETILLADGAISGEGVGSLLNGDFRWAAVSDLKDGSPLGKSAAHFVILSASLVKVIKSLSSSLTISASNNLDTLIDLDTTLNSSLVE